MCFPMVKSTLRKIIRIDSGALILGRVFKEREKVDQPEQL